MALGVVLHTQTQTRTHTHTNTLILRPRIDRNRFPMIEGTSRNGGFHCVRHRKAVRKSSTEEDRRNHRSFWAGRGAPAEGRRDLAVEVGRAPAERQNMRWRWRAWTGGPLTYLGASGSDLPSPAPRMNAARWLTNDFDPCEASNPSVPNSHTRAKIQPTFRWYRGG